MRDSTLKRVKDVLLRHSELETLMSGPAVASDPDALRRFGQKYSDLQIIVDLACEHEHSLSEAGNAQSILVSETDPEVVDLARDELASLETRLAGLVEQIETALLPKEKTEHANAVVEIRAGTGGDEAGLFAADLLRMYRRYCEARNLKLELIHVNETGVGGIKEAIFEVSGEDTYKLLRHESGVHRVQRVPATESQGRIHTSTATIAVLPKAEEIDVEVKPDDIRIDIFHAGGHGGQNVNKVATAVRITHLSTGLVVVAQRERSQAQNRQTAMEVLRSRLWDVELRRQQESISANRRAQVGSGNRSEKIRTYNFPQGRVTDHRISHTHHNLPKFLDGEMDDMIAALNREQQALRIAVSARS